MKHILTCAAAVLLLNISSVPAAEDLISPKAVGNQGIRVMLHINGNPRWIDYPDVYRVLCSEPLKIVFETIDGCVVVHQGTYTVIQQKAAFTEHVSRGVRFYDAK
jgi:hypothetical protein